MAMQTGVSSSKIIILLGAGLTGSTVLRSGRLSEVISELQELMKGESNVNISSHYNGALLSAQIQKFTQEVRELASSRPVRIFNGDNMSNGLAFYILPAAAVGAAGYCYMWLKGWSLSDVMFVTKRNMANAVATVSKQLDQVSTALALTKKHLANRLENIDFKVEEQKETSKLILNEVDDLKTDLSQIGFDIGEIQRMVTGLEGKIGLLDDKQDTTNAGVWYLCQVAGGIKDGINAKKIQDASAKFSLKNSSPFFSEEMSSSKGLQFLNLSPQPLDHTSEPNCENTNTTLLEKDDHIHKNKPSKNIVMRAGALHRSISSCGVSLSSHLV